jgi:hypothetical protein
MHFVYKFNKKKKRFDDPVVRIDGPDVWSMDTTLSFIVVPMLERLVEDKMGAPFVADADVPEELRSDKDAPKENSWDIDDERHFARWEWVINEMIWAWKMVRDHDGADTSIYTDKIPKGISIHDYPPMTDEEFAHINGQEKRIYNGLRLFGTYMRGLWT